MQSTPTACLYIMRNPIIWLIDRFKSNNNELELKKETTAPSVISAGSPCCDALVNIVYRGVSDDRLYMAYQRKWPEIKFFRPHGLRAYCHKCRQRIL